MADGNYVVTLSQPVALNHILQQNQV